MPYAIELVKDAKYSSVVLTGEVTRNDFENARDEANLMLKTNGWNSLLVDGTRGNPRVSVAEDFKFTSELQTRFPEGIRITLVLRPDQLESSRFIENIAQNRRVNQKLFGDKIQALHWMLGS
jgi:hypothetical protein